MPPAMPVTAHAWTKSLAMSKSATVPLPKWSSYRLAKDGVLWAIKTEGAKAKSPPKSSKKSVSAWNFWWVWAWIISTLPVLPKPYRAVKFSGYALLAKSGRAWWAWCMYSMSHQSALHQRDKWPLAANVDSAQRFGQYRDCRRAWRRCIRLADHIIDGRGCWCAWWQYYCRRDGKDIAKNPESLTGQYLSGQKKIAVPTVRHRAKIANDDKYEKMQDSAIPLTKTKRKSGKREKEQAKKVKSKPNPWCWPWQGQKVTTLKTWP